MLLICFLSVLQWFKKYFIGPSFQKGGTFFSFLLYLPLLPSFDSPSFVKEGRDGFSPLFVKRGQGEISKSLLHLPFIKGEVLNPPRPLYKRGKWKGDFSKGG